VTTDLPHILAGSLRARTLDFVQITKPGLTGMAVATAAVGAYIAGPPSVPLLAGTIMGTYLLGSGAVGLNQVMERRKDALMSRTCSRPLPSGRLTVSEAVIFSLALAAGGVFILAALTTFLAGLLGIVTLLSYTCLYTPLKTRTHLATLVGGVPGALPPVIGWAAATGALGLEPFILFTVLYLWQIPHFLALAWLYKADYSRAGYRMLPSYDERGIATSLLVLLYCVALVPASILPTVSGMAGLLPGFGGAVAAVVFAISGIRFLSERSGRRARVLFLSSLMYTPTMFGLLLADRILLTLG
jgi:protoheme IX farnesyltransferase